MHEYVESSLPMFPTFTILYPKLWDFVESPINEYSDFIIIIIIIAKSKPQNMHSQQPATK